MNILGVSSNSFIHKVIQQASSANIWNCNFGSKYMEFELYLKIYGIGIEVANLWNWNCRNDMIWNLNS